MKRRKVPTAEDSHSLERVVILSDFFVFHEDIKTDAVLLNEAPGGLELSYWIPVFWVNFFIPHGTYKVHSFNLDGGGLHIWTESLSTIENPKCWQQFCILDAAAVLRPRWYIVAVQPNDRRPQSEHRPLFLINTTNNVIEGAKKPKGGTS